MPARMWKKRNAYTLLAGMQISAAIIGVIMVVSQMPKSM